MYNKMNFNIDTLIKMGKTHSLHCEDDYIVVENDNFLVAAVFDGCSSGIDSHYASTKHKYLMKEVAENFNWLWDYKKKHTIKDNVFYFVFSVHNELKSEKYEVNKEMLSTIVLLFINKHTNEYGIVFCGDGCCFINGENISVHDEHGNAVWYLSMVTDKQFEEYFENYCHYYEGVIDNNMEIAISSDGIESFMTKYGSYNKEYPQDIFFNTKNSLPEKYHNWKLERLYNVLTKGKLPNMENDEGLSNIDDLTIIKVKIDKDKTDEVA